MPKTDDELTEAIRRAAQALQDAIFAGVQAGLKVEVEVVPIHVLGRVSPIPRLTVQVARPVIAQGGHPKAPLKMSFSPPPPEAPPTPPAAAPVLDQDHYRRFCGRIARAIRVSLPHRQDAHAALLALSNILDAEERAAGPSPG